MKLSPVKTKVIDNCPSPTRTLYDDDIDFELLNEINKDARASDEDNVEEFKKVYQEKVDAVSRCTS